MFRTITFAVAIGIIFAGVLCGAEDRTVVTNEVPLSVERFPLQSGYRDVFFGFVQSNMVSLFESELHPLQEVRRTLKYSSDYRRYSDDINDDILRAISSTFSYSARETFLETPLVMSLERMGDSISEMFRGSIGSVEEEQVEPEDVSYNRAAENWWKRLKKNGVHYGVRPFRTSPYAYLSFHVGDHDRPGMFVDMRYRRRNLENDRLELALSLRPMPEYAIDVGTSYEFRGKNPFQGVTFRFHKEIRKGSLLFIGFRVGNESEFLAGFTMSR